MAGAMPAFCIDIVLTSYGFQLKLVIYIFAAIILVYAPVPLRDNYINYSLQLWGRARGFCLTDVKISKFFCEFAVTGKEDT